MNAPAESILVVEDEPVVALLERRRLERAGFRVDVAASADAAEALLRRQPVDLIVLDYNLPDIDGLAFYERLKSAGTNIPVIVVTGCEREATAIQALRAGVRDFVTKSVEYLDYLPEAVKRVLQQVRTERQLAHSEARLAAIIASARDAIIIVESDGRISLFNTAAEGMFRCASNLAEGRDISDFIPDQQFTASRPVPGNGAPAADPFEAGDIGRRADGSQFPIEALVSSVQADGRSIFAVMVRDVTERHEYIRTIRRAHEETIHRLLAVSAFRDTETGAHIRRTGLLSEVLALAAGWEPSRAEELRMAATMHDIGKVGIPDAVLRKPGRLTEEEVQIMRTHALLGAKMLGNPQSCVMQLAQQIALAHHERWDGKGYPHGLAGTDIDECARIVAIVDVYDALSHERVYRPAYSEPEVIAMLLASRGSHFDPHLLDCFLGVFEEIRRINEANPDAADESESQARLSALPGLIAHVACDRG